MVRPEQSSGSLCLAESMVTRPASKRGHSADVRPNATTPARRLHLADAVSRPEWQRSGRLSALRTLAANATTLTWSPRLLRLLLEELFVEEDFMRVCGNPRKLPVRRYAQGIFIALAVRHSWREDDLRRFASRLGIPRRPARSTKRR